MPLGVYVNFAALQPLRHFHASPTPAPLVKQFQIGSTTRGQAGVRAVERLRTGGDSRRSMSRMRFSFPQRKIVPRVGICFWKMAARWLISLAAASLLPSTHGQGNAHSKLVLTPWILKLA